MMMRQKKAGRFGGLPFLEKHRSKKGRFEICGNPGGLAPLTKCEQKFE